MVMTRNMVGWWCLIGTVVLLSRHADASSDDKSVDDGSLPLTRRRRTSTTNVATNLLTRSSSPAVDTAATVLEPVAACATESPLVILEAREDANVFSFSMTLRTMVPTSPGSTVFDVSLLTSLVQSWLTSTGTPEVALLDPTTPAGQAYQYIQEMLAEIVATTSSRDEAQQKIYQHFALATLYYSTNGNNWTNRMGWLQFNDACEWTKVICRAMNSTTGNGGDGTGALTVTKLLLDDNNLVGTLPSELKLLTSMEEFIVTANTLSSTLPSELSTSWTRLETIDIEANALTGNPWSILLAFPNLQRLHVSDNPFSSDSNDTNETSSASAALSEWMSSSSASNTMRELWMGNTNFVGTLPTFIGRLQSLESLYIFDNVFTGTIPTELGSMPRLADILAHDNQIQGTLPEQLFGGNDMVLPVKRMRWDGNQLSGTISSNIAVFAPTLRDLRLDSNELTGVVPNELWQLSQLELLSLSNNTLFGTIPDDAFVNFDSLDTVDLANNQLSGVIPSSLFAVPTIRLVYLSRNVFTGSIPTNFGEAELLRDLYLDHNMLQGSIPNVEKGQLLNLTEFLMQGNDIQGTMPASICELIPSAALEDLWADCGGAAVDNTTVECECCTQCVFLQTE